MDVVVSETAGSAAVVVLTTVVGVVLVSDSIPALVVVTKAFDMSVDVAAVDFTVGSTAGKHRIRSTPHSHFVRPMYISNIAQGTLTIGNTKGFTNILVLLDDEQAQQSPMIAPRALLHFAHFFDLLPEFIMNNR